MAAKETMSQAAWAYYSSGADDEITMRDNHLAYQRLWFRPRVLVDVTKIDHSTTVRQRAPSRRAVYSANNCRLLQMLGTKVSLPIYITATCVRRCWSLL